MACEMAMVEQATRTSVGAAPHQMMMAAALKKKGLGTAPHAMMMAPAPKKELRLCDLETVCELGMGNCGGVTKVRLRGSSAEFALKMTHYSDDDSSVREAEVLLRTSGSPHLVRCHAVLRGDGGDPVMLLELMDAGSLQDVLARRGHRGFPEPAVAEVAARCLAGLAHLHSRGVAHLDVKPENLLASSRGDVKIGDFDQSKVFLGASGEPLQVSIEEGCAPYMSPERFEPGVTVGPKGACAADVWSVGITVADLFSGTPMEMPAYNLELPTSASAELQGFLVACLHKDPMKRATVAQLLSHPFVARRNVQASRRALQEVIESSLRASPSN